MKLPTRQVAGEKDEEVAFGSSNNDEDYGIAG